MNTKEEKKDRLTKQQEGFIRDVLKGMTKTDAYKNNYKADNMKKETIHKRAYELFKVKKVKERYEELKKEIDEERIFIKNISYEKNDAIEDLIFLKDKAKESINENGLKQANSQAFLNAVKELCTIQNIYPSKNSDDTSKAEDQIAKDLISIMEQVKNN